MSECYVGLMSGTSADGVDAVVVDFTPFPPRLLASQYSPFEDGVRQRILALMHPGEAEIERMGQLDRELGALFATAAERVIAAAKLERRQIMAIGCHGQTVRHQPRGEFPYTLQIGDPNTIARHTGITTVADFRRGDLVVGGEGAPLAPAYHHWAAAEHSGVVVNIGGMANVTLLPKRPGESVRGFDTGPGNVLLDLWVAEQYGERFDRDGVVARSGWCSEPLLRQLLQEPYFQRPPPKSTGRERFHRAWLMASLERITPRPSSEDVLATLVELTASTISAAVKEYSGDPMIWVCGGGVHNLLLMERLAARLPGWQVDRSDVIGIPPDWVEAITFAWLARQTLHGLEGNLPTVTGASDQVMLGGVYPGSPDRLHFSLDPRDEGGRDTVDDQAERC